jgi:hypothetical protein
MKLAIAATALPLLKHKILAYISGQRFKIHKQCRHPNKQPSAAPIVAGESTG